MTTHKSAINRKRTDPQTGSLWQPISSALPHSLSRRQWLRDVAVGAVASGTLWAAPWAFGQSQNQSNTDPKSAGGRFVLVLLRGAYDGLSALVPYGDAEYARLRPTIAIPTPDGTNQSALQLDAMFGLHPAMSALYPLWQQGVLAAIPCAGSPDSTRSHFDAQHHWETGVPGKSSGGTGWLNTLSGQIATPASSIGLGVGEANPLILAGPQSVQLVPRGKAATQQGALGNANTRDALLRLYAGSDPLAQAFRTGAQSRMQTSQMLGSETMAADNGAGPPTGLALDARHLGTLMRQDHRLRVGFLSAGGWDTHANQGAVTGALASNLESLAKALVQLRNDFSQPDDVVVVCSEFGRTCAENGTRGTDHGHGNALWIMGNRVRGGQVHGQWTGLAAANLNEGRDLPVHHDFRAVLAQVLAGSQGLRGESLDRLFPGFRWDDSLNQLMRA